MYCNFIIVIIPHHVYPCMCFSMHVFFHCLLKMCVYQWRAQCCSSKCVFMYFTRLALFLALFLSPAARPLPAPSLSS